MEKFIGDGHSPERIPSKQCARLRNNSFARKKCFKNCENWIYYIPMIYANDTTVWGIDLILSSENLRYIINYF